jgi:arsenate reductase (thioredoxin)
VNLSRRASAEFAGTALESHVSDKPRKLDYATARDSDVVVTMGCGDTCPVFPGKRYEDWNLTDPAGQPIEVVRGVRDDICSRVEKLLADLDPA